MMTAKEKIVIPQLRILSDNSLDWYRRNGKLSAMMIDAIVSVRDRLAVAEEALKPFAEEYQHWSAFEDDFRPRINDYDEEKPDEAEFTVGDLRKAAEILGLTCVDEGCPHRGTPHDHGHTDDGGV